MLHCVSPCIHETPCVALDVVCVFIFTSSLSSATCTKPNVKSSTYSTENQYFSSESVFIAQVEVDCGGEVL